MSTPKQHRTPLSQPLVVRHTPTSSSFRDTAEAPAASARREDAPAPDDVTRELFAAEATTASTSARMQSSEHLAAESAQVLLTLANKTAPGAAARARRAAASSPASRHPTAKRASDNRPAPGAPQQQPPSAQGPSTGLARTSGRAAAERPVTAPAKRAAPGSTVAASARVRPTSAAPVAGGATGRQAVPSQTTGAPSLRATAAPTPQSSRATAAGAPRAASVRPSSAAAVAVGRPAPSVTLPTVSDMARSCIEAPATSAPELASAAALAARMENGEESRSEEAQVPCEGTAEAHDSSLRVGSGAAAGPPGPRAQMQARAPPSQEMVADAAAGEDVSPATGLPTETQKLLLVQNRRMQCQLLAARQRAAFSSQAEAAEEQILGAALVVADQRRSAADAQARLDHARIVASLAAVAREQAPLLQQWAALAHRHRDAADGAVRAAEVVAAHVPLVNGAVADQEALTEALRNAAEAGAAACSKLEPLSPLVASRGDAEAVSALCKEEEALLTTAGALMKELADLRAHEMSLTADVIQHARRQQVVVAAAATAAAPAAAAAPPPSSLSQ